MILDVVYNHTAEGNHLGPVLSLKGLDNAAYYRLVDDDPAYYFDYTGTGNSLNMRHPHVLQLIMDSLRYWVLEMHVDGFRFDLAATLARELHDVDRLSAFFDLIQQDPVVSQVKLIAEPWDVGEGGYQVGNFPPLWSEWNGKYRDTVRDFWRGEDQTLAEFAYRFTGSPDLYESSGRRPSASINFVTAHDGFTLADLVVLQREAQRGQRRGQQRRREPQPLVELRRRRAPPTTPRSSSCGPASGATSWPPCCCPRASRCSWAATSMGRTQQGNNNAYCQDNEISWFDWDAIDGAMLAFTSRLIDFRRDHPIFRRRRWFQGRALHGEDVLDIAWFRPDGTEMEDADWESGFAKSIGVYLNGDEIHAPDSLGQRHRRRQLPGHLQRPPRRGRLHPAPRALRHGLGESGRHRRLAHRGRPVQGGGRARGHRPHPGPVAGHRLDLGGSIEASRVVLARPAEAVEGGGGQAHDDPHHGQGDG